MISARVRVNLRPLKGIQRRLRGGAGPEWRQIRKEWSTRISAFLRRRFQKLSTSGGGGEWPKLAASTRQAKGRKGKGAKFTRHGGRRRFSAKGWRHSILVDTGMLKKALNVGAVGNLNRPIKRGIRFGIKGGGHPEGVTIGQLAEIHHKGLGNVPARPIVVPPDRKTCRSLETGIARALKRLGY